MRRRDPTGFLSLCLSLAAHGVLVMGAIRYGALSEPAAVARVTPRANERVTYKELESLLDETATLAPRQPQEKKTDKPPEQQPSRLVPIVRPAAPVFVPDEIGKHDGKGTAIADSDGKEQLVAREGGQDQPLLRRNPGAGMYVPAPMKAPPGPLAKPADGGAAGAAATPAHAPNPPPPQTNPPAQPTPPPKPTPPSKPMEKKTPAHPQSRTGPKNDAQPNKPVAGEKVPPRENMLAGAPANLTNPPPGKVAVGKLQRERAEKRQAVAPQLPPPAPSIPDAIAESPFTLKPRPTTGPTDPKAPPDQTAVAEIKPQAEKKPAVAYAISEVKQSGSEGNDNNDASPPAPQRPPLAPNVTVAEADLQAFDQPTPDRPAAPATAPPLVPAGDPAPKADTESDPFTKIGAVTFHGNRAQAKFGRKVIVRQRPEIDPLNEMDVFTAARTVQLRVDIDATGKVTRVDVLKSSRYPDTIDLPCVRALYTWWIEPPKDKNGKPTGDSMLWTITIR